MSKRSACLLTLPMVLLSVQGIRAQTSTAQITGRVTDPSGAVVNAAKVRITNMDTGETRDTLTLDSGYYTAPLLDLGRYQVSIAMPGFRPVTRPNITLQVDQVARIDFTLELGSESETVLVKAEAPLLDSATSSLGQLVENRAITELPVNGRNTMAFVALTPGVRSQYGMDANPYTQALVLRGNFSANGGITGANEELVDGAPVTTARGNNIGWIPPEDATQEFRVETNSFSGEYGRSSGAVVNLGIKSGTNQVHGTLYEFFRNSALDSNPFFQNKAGLPKLPLRLNQYGGSVGGPIRRDKTFFFANVEVFDQRQGNTLTTTVPTALQRVGNFSQTFNAAGQLVQIADPLTTALGANGTYTRGLFPGNQIPASRLSASALKFQQIFWPLPNAPGAPFTGVNNLSAFGSQPIDARQGVGKIDHTLNAKWKLFLMYAQEWLDRGPLDELHNKITPDTNGFVETDTSRDVVLAATAVLNPRWIGEFRSSFIRLGQDRIPNSVPFDLTSIGMPASLNKVELQETVPQINVAGVLAVPVGAVAVIVGRTNNWTESASMTWIAGKHTIKFGGNYRIGQLNDYSASGLGPALNFTGQFTSANPLAVTSTSGVGLASYLLGFPITGSMVQPQPLADQRWYMATFLQDDWKVSQRLTLNLGMQYSFDSSITERYNRVAWFDPTAVPPVAQAVGFPAAGALQFGGSGTRTPENLYKKQWGPRAGFAFQAHSNTVLRGGYGIFWLPNDLFTQSTSARSTPWNATTTFLGSLDGGVTPHDTMDNPFPNGLLAPPGSSLGLNSLIGQVLQAFERSTHTGYMQVWNFDVQQNLWKNIVLDVAYAGSKGTGLPVNVEINQLPDQYLSMGTALTQQVANPFFGQVTSGTLSPKTVARSQLLRPYPQFDTITVTGENAASSSYHSLQVKVTKRFGASLVQAAYTWSKAIGDSETQPNSAEVSGQPGNDELSDNYNRRLDRSLSAFDTPHRLVTSYTLDLPFGKGQRFLTGGGAFNRFVAGWQLTGIYTAQSGTPVFLSTASNLTNAYVPFARPNNNGHSAALSGSAQSRLGEWFNTSVFSQPPAFTFGTTGRTLPDVRDHGINNLDLGVFKNNRFGHDGRLNLQVRGEFFNVANRVRFLDPGLVYGTPQFGVVSGQVNSPRQIQIALKLIY